MKLKISVNVLFALIVSLFLVFCGGYVARPLSKIVSKIEIVNVVGLKIVREEGIGYKLVDVPSNINILDARIANSGEVYKFSNQDKILLDSAGNKIENLNGENYTLILNTKELGEIYKILNKTDFGYKVLDIKVTYNREDNSLDISNSGFGFEDSEITIFKNDSRVSSVKLNSEGKGKIYVNDIQNLTTSTYTILVKKGSEILGIDAFHATPVHREFNLKDNVKFTITSKITNKLCVSIKPESGITQNDKVQVVSVYEESNPNENLLLDVSENLNLISNLNGEVFLKSTLVEGKKYIVKLKINGFEISSQDCCDVHIRNLDTSKIKITAVEKIGKELKIDLSGIENLTKDDLIEVVSLHDVNSKDKNLISKSKLTNKVNEIPLVEKIESGNSYETIIKINDFEIGGLLVEVIPVDLSNSIALTDIISNKIFISLENAKGLKITDSVEVVGVFVEGDSEKNFLKSNYNTEIENLNGTVFLNYTLDTKNNYYIKFKVNGVELENPVKITVNNDISFKGAVARVKPSSLEVEICFKNVDSINYNDVIEIKSIFDINNEEENLLDEGRGIKIFDKKGVVYLKAPLLEDCCYGMKIKINNVEFQDVIPVFTKEEIKNETAEIKNSEIKILNIESIEFLDCGLKFKHNLNENFDTAICYTPGINSTINEDYIILEGFVPFKKYKSINVIARNDNGGVVEFEIPEFVFGESEDQIKNFISKTYIKIKNGLSTDENNFEFVDEVGFRFWNDKIKNGEVDLRNFVFEVLEEENFFRKYIDNTDKIKILYNVIFGIEPTEQSINVWLNDLNKIMKDEDEDKSFNILIEKMFTNLKFKSLEKQLK